MKISLNKISFNVLKFMISATVCGVLSLYIHEVFHLCILKVLGGNGFIKFTGFIGRCTITKMPSNLFLVALAGGVGCGLTYLLFAWLSYRKRLWESYAAFTSVALSQLFYGVYEATCITRIPMDQYRLWLWVVMIAGFFVGFYLSFFKYRPSLTKSEVLKGS